MTTNELLIKSKAASRELALLSAEKKNDILLSMADALIAHAEDILSANRTDLENAKGRISDAMADRLLLSKERILAMADGVRAVAALDDPAGRVASEYTRPDGLVIRKLAVPFGVIAIIYESRPNVTSDAAALCIKSGNACVLRSGKDAYLSAKAITEAMRLGIRATGVSPDIVGIVDDPSRKSAEELMRADGLVDLLIPRGGAGLIRSVVENATVPCIETGTGICHIYVDSAADIEKALKIVENAKTSRPSVCNAAEVLLVHKDICKEFLPRLKGLLVDGRRARGAAAVELRLDGYTSRFTDGTPASDADFDTEFLDYILAVKAVSGVCEAVAHIDRHSTHHSEAIVTEDGEAARYFTESVDSAAVYWNASTRFTDGGEFGFGCEMGISTQKLHARGPMGLSELCTYKYIVIGNGNIR